LFPNFQLRIAHLGEHYVLSVKDMQEKKHNISMAYRKKLETEEQVLPVYSTYCSTVRAGVPVQRARMPSFPDTIFFVASQGPSVVTVTRDLIHSSGVPPLSPEAILNAAPRTKFLVTLDGIDWHDCATRS
jgi:hypothetical protein